MHTAPPVTELQRARRWGERVGQWFCPASEPRASDCDPEHLQQVIFARKLHLRRLLGVGALLVLAVLGLRRVLQRELTDFDETFRPSVPVGPGDLRAATGRVYGSSLPSKLVHLLREPDFREVCGLAAPNVRVYEQYALLRLGALFQDVANPAFVPHPHARQTGALEHSLMCHGNGDADTHVWRERYDAIVASFDSAHGRMDGILLTGLSLSLSV